MFSLEGCMRDGIYRSLSLFYLLIFNRSIIWNLRFRSKVLSA